MVKHKSKWNSSASLRASFPRDSLGMSEESGILPEKLQADQSGLPGQVLGNSGSEGKFTSQ